MRKIVRLNCLQVAVSLALGLCLQFSAVRAQAGEDIFGYVYTTDMMPKGKYEFEQWITDREGQAHGYFHHIDMNSEIEYGVTNNFQVGLYANYMFADEYHNSVRGLTEGIEIPWYHDANSPYEAGRFDGLSLELMYRFLNPFLDPVGFAVYVEPEVGYYEQSVEYRAIVQKNYLDDMLIFAANLWVEPDREQNSNLVDPLTDNTPPNGAWSTATYAELDLGASYRFRPNWSIGVEGRNHNEFRGYTLAQSAQDHSAFFLGPNVHYATQKWYATLTILRQLGAMTYVQDQADEQYRGLLYGDEHTTWDGIRLKIGHPF